MGYTKRRELAERELKKLTGKELFMTDKTLDQSDLKFLNEGIFLLYSFDLCKNVGIFDSNMILVFFVLIRYC